VGIGGVELAAIRSNKSMACPRGSRPNAARHRGKYDFYTVELFGAAFSFRWGQAEVLRIVQYYGVKGKKNHPRLVATGDWPRPHRAVW